jgi:hypothetical protein
MRAFQEQYFFDVVRKVGPTLREFSQSTLERSGFHFGAFVACRTQTHSEIFRRVEGFFFSLFSYEIGLLLHRGGTLRKSVMISDGEWAQVACFGYHKLIGLPSVSSIAVLFVIICSNFVHFPDGMRATFCFIARLL